MRNSKNEVVINEKNEVVVNDKSKKRSNKGLFFAIIATLVFGTYLFVSSNFFYKVFPDALAPRAFSKTASVINKETKSFQKAFKEHSADAKLSDINSYNFDFGSLVATFTEYDDFSSLILNFGDSLLIDFSISEEDFIFKINDSNYYSIDLNETNEEINSEDKTTQSPQKTSSVQTETKLAEINIGNYTDEFDKVSALLLKDSVVVIGNLQNTVLIEYTKDEFITLVSDILEVTPNDDNIEFSELILNSFVLGSDKVFIQYNVDSVGSFKNCITEINIYTDAKNKKFFKLHSTGTKNLLDELTFSYKLFAKERDINITTNFSTFENDLKIGINDLDFVFNITNDDSTVSLATGDKTFLTLSNDPTDALMPADAKMLNETGPLELYFDIMNIDFEPFTNFMDSFEDFVS